MKRKFKQWWSTIPIVSTNQTITSLLNSLNTTKYDITIWKCMSWLGGHNNVVSVKELMESQPSIYILFLVFAPGLKWRRTDHTNSRFNNTVALMIWLKLWVTYCHGLITKIEFFMIYIYLYVWKLNQTVLELDFRAVNFLFFSRRDLNTHHWYTEAPFA